MKWVAVVAVEGKRVGAPLYRHWGSVQAVPPTGGVRCTLVQALGLCTGRTAHRGSKGTLVQALGFCTGRTAHRGSNGTLVQALWLCTGRTAHRGSKDTLVQALRLCTGRTAHRGSKDTLVQALRLCTGRTAHRGSNGTLVQALGLCTGRTTHRGSRGIALLYLDHGTRRGEGSVSRPGRSLPPRKTRYPFYRRLGGPQGRYGQVRKISPPQGFDPRDRPARSQSLYRLSYRACNGRAYFI